jgi:hypothetical protein
MINCDEIGCIKKRVNQVEIREKKIKIISKLETLLTTNEPHTTAKASSGASCFPK